MKAIQIQQPHVQQSHVQQPHVMNDKERKSLLLIAPILIGATAYGASIGFMVIDNFLRVMF